MNPSQQPGEPVPKFRINAQVFQIFGLLAVALALPITILILGIKEIRKEQHSVDAENRGGSNAAAELPGLRQSLETIAENHLTNAHVDSPVRIYRVSLDSSEKRLQKCSQISDFLSNSKFSFIESRGDKFNTWTVSVDPSRVQYFENELASLGFLMEKTGEGSDSIKSNISNLKSAFYKIYIETLAP